jgi:hypothetical protein
VVLIKEINQIATNQSLHIRLERLQKRFLNLFKKQAETSGLFAEHELVPHIFAYVTFDADGNAAIDSSFNISSITENGIGDVTVNLDKGSDQLTLPQGSSGSGAAPSVRIENPSTLRVKWDKNSRGKVHICVHEMRSETSGNDSLTKYTN